MLKIEQERWLELLEEQRHATPFMVTDLQKFRDNVQLLSELLPNVGIYYAIKSRSDRQVIESIDDLVDGYDIASYGEYKLLEDVGVKPGRVLYSNPVKIPSHITHTYREGVRFFAFDSLDEAKKLAKLAPESNVYLRVKVSDYGSKFPLSSKFGVDPLHAVAYADTARELGLNVCGLSFHVGSQSENPQTWKVAFKTAGQIIEKLHAVGINISVLNMGGGLPVVYTEQIATIRHITGVINQAIDQYIPAGVRVIAEPGRYISANTSVIVSSVIAREHRGGSEWLFLDMGVFQGLMEPLEMQDWRYPIFSRYGRQAADFSRSFVLTGPTCDAFDTIGFDYQLPSNIDVGDRVYIAMTGAYTTVYQSHFNGFNPPTIHYLPVTNLINKELKSWHTLLKRQKSLLPLSSK